MIDLNEGLGKFLQLRVSSCHTVLTQIRASGICKGASSCTVQCIFIICTANFKMEYLLKLQGIPGGIGICMIPTFKDLAYVCMTCILFVIMLLAYMAYWRRIFVSGVYTRVVDYRIQVGAEELDMLSAKISFTSIAELHASIKATRHLSEECIILFKFSRTFIGVDGHGDCEYSYRWMELTDLSHPWEVPKELIVWIINRTGETFDQWQRL